MWCGQCGGEYDRGAPRGKTSCSDRISLIDFAWQYDVSQATVDQWVIDFGMTGQPNENAFKQYLWTLGLSNYDGSEKLALQRLRDELQARAWVR